MSFQNHHLWIIHQGRRSLLWELWRGSSAATPEQLDKAVSEERNLTRKGMTYSEVLSSSSKGNRNPKRVKQKMESNLTGTKRPRYPGSQPCGRCFRMTHKTSECWHQVVCLYCACVGHVVARCRVVPRHSLKRKRMHVRSKKSSEPTDQRREMVSKTPAHASLASCHLWSRRSTLSLPLSPEIAVVREELAKVAIRTILSGFVMDASLEEVLPMVINFSLAGPLTPLNDNTYLVPLLSRAEAKEVCKMREVQFRIKEGLCSAKLEPWSAELGAIDRASGDGQWVRIWNLPMHGWCWSVILEVLKTIGEQVSLSQEFKTNKRFISALVHRRVGVSLPVELELSLGIRRYMVILMVDKGPQPVYCVDLNRFILPDVRHDGEFASSLLRRATHEIAPGEKGKQPISDLLRSCPDRLVELTSHLDIDEAK